MQQASHGFRTVCFFFVFVFWSSSSCSQGTPPFMALEIMLQSGKNFHHELRHDLESLLYVVFWVCNHMTAPGVERDLANGKVPHVRGWCNMAFSLQDLGHLKLAHIVDAERIILAEFTPYWEDFKPFATRLLKAFFPISPAEPNNITPDIMLDILKDALSVIQEPRASGLDRLKERERESEPALQVYATLAGIKRDQQGQDVVVVSKRIKQSKVTTRFMSAISQLESVGPDFDCDSTSSAIISIDSV